MGMAEAPKLPEPLKEDTLEERRGASADGEKMPNNSSKSYGGFHKWRIPKLVGLFHGKSQQKMEDDWGYPYDSGNLHMVSWKDVLFCGGEC